MAKRVKAGAAAKVDNHAAAAPGKVALRRWLLEEIGAERARVFDAFAGSGAMFRSTWNRAGEYTGCDQRRFGGTRAAFVADNCRVLRAVDLAAFNIFDLDAYGSPWKQATIIAARRTLAAGERVGFALTDGSPMRARFGAVEASLAAMAGVARAQTGLSLRWRELTARAVVQLAARMGGRVVEFRCADSRSRPILYSAALIEGVELGQRDLAGAKAEQVPGSARHTG